ncbi:thioredoxin domain-containing protein [Parvularcula sp. IMCC14364]|uniref:TlpA family protein disulfide reductase n=1 Tax=Parvularcula sp. IMCC14364 TaxID=3067902 RepID=UPI0027412D5B|nr:thioredoxin domain-containing protein [Parvularcula sp. IMCC14364]
MRLLTAMTLFFLAITVPVKAADADIYLVSFTADWCPNCRVLDPKMEEALGRFSDGQIEHIVLDMTDAETREQSFLKVDGTVFAGVYGDHLGVTGIGILTAPDSGEKIACVTREQSTEEIVEIFRVAREIVLTEPALQRQTGLGMCPVANDKVAL